MSNYDDLFSVQENTPAEEPTLNPFDKDEFKAKKQAERDEVYGMIDSTVEKMKCSGELFQSYLDVQARFDRYTVNNAILITTQLPSSTRLADYDAWQKENVQVNKGEKSIAILEPGREFTREDGSTATGFNVKRVFDVSQTNSAQKVTPSVTRDERLLLKSLITHAPCQMTISNRLPENSNASYSPKDKTIYVRPGLEAPEIFRAISTELAHAHMDNGESEYKRNSNLHKAYCVSYLLCKRYGVPNDSIIFNEMPAEYAKMDNKEFRKELTTIRDVAGEISRDMNRVLEAQDRSKKERSGDAR